MQISRSLLFLLEANYQLFSHVKNMTEQTRIWKIVRSSAITFELRNRNILFLLQDICMCRDKSYYLPNMWLNKVVFIDLLISSISN